MEAQETAGYRFPAVEIEVRRGDPSGARLARMALKPQPNDNGDSSHSVALAGGHDTDDLCLVFKGGPGELIRLNRRISAERRLRIFPLSSEFSSRLAGISGTKTK